MKKRVFGLIVGLIIVLMILPSLCAQDENISLEEQATVCLQNSKVISEELKTDGFVTARVDDLINQAQTFYDAQYIKHPGNRDFSLVTSICEEIVDIKKLANTARDEFKALVKFYNESLTSSMNTSSVDVLINEVDFEIKSERYEKVDGLVSKTYEEIINLQSSYTTLNLFKDYTAGIFYLIFVKRWKTIVSILIVLFVLYFIYRIKVQTMIINRKMEGLEVRKKTLKTLIKQTQRDYFEYGRISEGSYNIRTTKFAEMIRDIDRQIPLLREELAKISKKARRQKENESKKAKRK